MSDAANGRLKLVAAKFHGGEMEGSHWKQPLANWPARYFHEHTYNEPDGSLVRAIDVYDLTSSGPNPGEGPLVYELLYVAINRQARPHRKP
jgi:hypothetical protein